MGAHIAPKIITNISKCKILPENSSKNKKRVGTEGLHAFDAVLDIDVLLLEDSGFLCFAERLIDLTTSFIISGSVSLCGSATFLLCGPSRYLQQTKHDAHDFRSNKIHLATQASIDLHRRDVLLTSLIDNVDTPECWRYFHLSVLYILHSSLEGCSIVSSWASSFCVEISLDSFDLFFF